MAIRSCSSCPEETAYFPTALNKYGKRGRRAQVDYLTKEALSRVLFGGPPEWEKWITAIFRQRQFRERFETAAFDPNNAAKDLLVLMMETYAEMLAHSARFDCALGGKTPANRRFIPQILERFPQAKLLITMRDPRAILAAQIALEKTRKTRRVLRFTIAFPTGCRPRSLALRAERKEISGIVTRYEDLVADPVPPMQRGLRLPRNHRLIARRLDADKGGQILAGKLGD